MVIFYNIKFVVFLLIFGIIAPSPAKCYSSRFFSDDNDDGYKKYLIRYYPSINKLPIPYQYFYGIKSDDNIIAPKFLVKDSEGNDNFEEVPEENYVIQKQFESDTTKRSSMGNKRNNSLKLKLLNQGARGFGKK
uniref:Uncharacterized protein n=1 Tax=Strongyloides stercoralis TaxID=6248 RepID=A0A0K0E3P3_STRER